MTVEAISKKSGVDAQTVKESLEQRERTYIELAAMSDEQIKEYIKNLQNKGRSTAEIAELTGYGTKKVNELIFGVIKGDKPKRGGHNKTSEDVKDKVIELKKQGLSTRDVADKTGVARSTVWRIWDNHKNKEGKPSQINEEFDKEVDKMIEESKNKEIIEEREEMPKEKAPETAKATPSAKEKVLQDKDITLLRKCQEELAIIMRGIMGSYTKMDDFEKQAFEIGCTYGRLSCLKSEIENA